MFIFKVMIIFKISFFKERVCSVLFNIKNKKKGKKSDHSKNKPTWFIAVEPAT